MPALLELVRLAMEDLHQFAEGVERVIVFADAETRIIDIVGDEVIWRELEHLGLVAGVSWSEERQGARVHGKLVALRGELAADTRVGPLLAGLGVQELSMNPSSIPQVKAALHAHPLSYWQQLAQLLLQAETAAEMRDVLQLIVCFCHKCVTICS